MAGPPLRASMRSTKVDAAAMKKTRHENQTAVVDAERELAQLLEQVEEAREALSGLRRAVAEAGQPVAVGGSSQLIETSEKLVRAALSARIEADSASLALGVLSRSTGFDALTGLPNRKRLLDRLPDAIEAAKDQGTKAALLFLDLDNFKQINNQFGHAVGDEVLKLVARRLSSLVRGADAVCRYGGDEFLILLAGISQPSDAALVANKLIASLGAATRVGEHVFHLGACIGICIFPDDGDDPQTLIERADAAICQAKRHRVAGSSFAFHGAEPVEGPRPKTRARGSSPRPAIHKGSATADYQRQHSQLREANTALVLAALDAQELQAGAERLQRHQQDSLAVVAHELRTPLTPIRIATDMLGRVRPDEMPRYQAIIENEIEHMVSVISDLLDVSRVDAGKLRIDRRRIDLTRVVTAAVDACQPAMIGRLQNLTVELPAETIELDADPVRLAQVLRNLLDNASKYTPQNGEIVLSVALAGENAVISVSDNGIGISAEALAGIFEPFTQEAHAIRFNGVGLGIGLTVVRELVAAHGGSVVASSDGAGQGSRFVLTLPLAPSKPGRKSRRRVAA